MTFSASHSNDQNNYITSTNCREKKQMFSLIHELANRWRTVSKIVFVYISSPANQGPLKGAPLKLEKHKVS